MKNIIKVWASTFNTRSLIWRAREGLPIESDPIGVAVLQMVNAKAAGVMFTAEPNTADSSKILIEGTWGVGESVVSGAVTPDTWVVDKASLRITDRRLSAKAADNSPIPETGNTSPYGNAHEGQKGCLSDEEVSALARTGKRIEEHFGSPQDIEWAVDGNSPPNNITILQTRPEKFRMSLVGF